MQLQVVGGQAAEDQHQSKVSVHSVTELLWLINTDYHFHVLVKNNEGEGEGRL